MARTFVTGLAAFAACALLLAGCDEQGNLALDAPAEGGAERAGLPGETVTREVEAPDVFQVSDEGLWDGRPSLGGVWVAHPDVDEPQRVRIRTAGGASVVGALFRRERENPGPPIQVSSEAAAALNMLAGQPAQMTVVALVTEEVEIAPPPAEATADFEAPDEIAATTLDPIDAAAAAIDSAEASEAVIAPAAAAPAPAPAPRAASTLDRPFIQIGIFSVEANAQATADRMRAAGIVPTVKREGGEDPYWRVIVGPATSEAERNDLLAKVKADGFADAYFVAN